MPNPKHGRRLDVLAASKAGGWATDTEIYDSGNIIVDTCTGERGVVRIVWLRTRGRTPAGTPARSSPTRQRERTATSGRSAERTACSPCCRERADDRCLRVFSKAGRHFDKMAASDARADGERARRSCPSQPERPNDDNGVVGWLLGAIVRFDRLPLSLTHGRACQAPSPRSPPHRRRPTRWHGRTAPIARPR